MSDSSKVKIIHFPKYCREDGQVTVIESFDALDFQLVRCFTLSNVPVNGVRGRHAHLKCTQVVSCSSGRVNIRWHDGIEWNAIELHDIATALAVKPGVWLELDFLEADSVVMVFCDRPFEEEDYISDFDNFLEITNK